MVQLQLLQCYWLGHRLGLPWYWMVCLGNRDHSVIFETASKYCILDSFVDHDGYSISSKGFLTTVVDIMVIWSGPITSWQIDGETVETVADFIFGGGSKITADGDCSHEIKKRSLLGRKVMTNLDSMLKSRDITLPTKVCLVKATVFPVVMYQKASQTIKKAECQITDAFELWCWRRLLRVP